MPNVKSTDVKVAVEFNLYKSMTSIVKGEFAGDRTRILVNDHMKAEGIELLWFKSPSKDAPDAHRDHYNATKAACIAAFSAADRKLHDAKSSDLEAGDAPGQRGAAVKPARGTRRYIRQQVGTKIGQFARSYKRYLHGPDSAADGQTTNDKTFCLERIVAMRKRLEKSDKATFDVVETLASLVKLEKLVNATV
tara:strand:- start:77 stop:655 length:579 start_codon:yes stop_codon:yes gene_type:complete